MYSSPVSLLLGFHGCDRGIGERILAGDDTHLRPSENAYDWLGHGVYFWEHNPERAHDFASYVRDNPGRSKFRINTPFVLGAVIDPGHCLNLLETESLRLVLKAYTHLRHISEEARLSLPVNECLSESGDFLRRDLDCAVIETLHDSRSKAGLPPFDTVRGVFEEGAPLYDGAGFRQKSHVQICVRDTASIKGYFRLLPSTGG